MSFSSISYPKPSPETPVGFGTDSCISVASNAATADNRRRRREMLEHYFSPIVSQAAMPSAVDRLVLWRSHHGRHLA